MRIAIMLALALPAAAAAQVAPGEAEEMTFAPPERRIARRPPSEEAMALGRRLAVALHQAAISRRVQALLAKAEEQPPPPAATPAPGGPIRAVPKVRPPKSWDWAIGMQERAIARVALVYAHHYAPAELAQMARFFESPAGRRYLGERERMEALVEAALAGPELERDLRDLVCRPQPPSGPVDGPDRAYVRLMPPPDGAPKPPSWCFAPVPARPRD